MVLSECYGFVKYALVFVNLIFCAIGLSGMILAIWMFMDQSLLISLAHEEHNFNAGLYILFSAGILMLIVSFLGCCGASRESQCMLAAFFSCLLVVIVAQIAAGAWLYTNGSNLEKLVKSSVIDTVKNKYGEDDGHTQAMNTFQSTLGCCGATGPADWTGSKYAIRNPSIPVSITVSNDANNVYKVPESCCKEQDNAACETARNIKVGGVISPLIYSDGCIDKLMDELNNQKNIVIGLVSGIGILELLGLIFSLVLYCAIGSSDRYKA